MTIIVEDGTGIANANSYVAVADADAYFTDVRNSSWFSGPDGNDIIAPERAAALIRTTMWIDGRYRGRYPGYRVKGRAQGLEWPRVGAYTYDPDNGRSNIYTGSGFYQSSQYLFGYNYIASNIVPREMARAVFEGAVRELATYGVLAPDLPRGGAIQEVHAGSVGVTYAAGADPTTLFQQIDLILASLLLGGSQYSSRAMRG